MSVNGTNVTGAQAYQSSAIYYDTSNIVYAQDFAAASDATLKTYVGSITNALLSVQQINGIKYVWNEKGIAQGFLNKDIQIGLYAQEVQEVLPEAVYQSNGYLNVSYDKLIPLLIEAIKELKNEIDLLKGGGN